MLFWELFDSWTYVSAESGQVFNIEDIPGGPKIFVFALLRDKDPVPCAEVPEDKVLSVYRRPGLELSIEKGCVLCAGPPEPTDIERWTIPVNIDVFQRDFTAAARA